MVGNITAKAKKGVSALWKVWKVWKLFFRVSMPLKTRVLDTKFATFPPFFPFLYGAILRAVSSLSAVPFRSAPCVTSTVPSRLRALLRAVSEL